MRFVDIALALVALLGFASFLGVIAVYVPQLPLVLIFIICVLMATFDLAREITKR